MFFVRRIFRNRKTLSDCISTSSAVQCKENKNSNKTSREKEEEENVNSKKAANLEGNRHKNLFSSSTEKNEKPLEFTSKPKKKQKPREAQSTSDIFQRILASSVEKVAENLGGNKMETKRDLLEYIKMFKVTKVPPPTTMRRTTSASEPIIEETERLNIFDAEIMEGTAEQVQLNIWDTLEVEDLEYNSLTSPRNYFEELIQWTNEGKLWRFPIDNDQGLEAEAKVSFTEHIFLDQYLEPWCPKKGPLRKFMELVLIGLSKNPYLTVEDKKEHIDWFRNYFEDKKKLLRELGAMGATKEIDAEK